MREEAFPVLGGEFGVFCQFALDHEFLDVIDGVDVRHAVFGHAPHFFEALVGAHGRDRVALDEDVGLREEFERFEGGAVGAEDSLATLDEAVSVEDEGPDFDYVCRHVVLEDFDGLGLGLDSWGLDSVWMS